jgi:hypothetical protein
MTLLHNTYRPADYQKAGWRLHGPSRDLPAHERLARHRAWKNTSNAAPLRP